MAVVEHPRQKTKRGQGQWGFGYHEPLNAAERVKRDDDGLNVRERIERIFSKEGFRSIGPQDLRSRFRWWGLYTQRKQGVPAGDTPRNMLGCPLAGIDADELIDATPQLLEANSRFVGDPAFSNLPRKYKTTITGCRHRCTHPEINDVAFVATVRNDWVGFDVWV